MPEMMLHAANRCPSPHLLLTWVRGAAVNLTQANKCFQQGMKAQEM